MRPLDSPDLTPSLGGTDTTSVTGEAPLPAAELQALLSSSATEIQAGHTADAKYPTLDQLVQTTTSGEYNQALFPDWVLFVKTQSVPLPDSLFDQYDLLHCRCFMGLFPEIQRAWLTIDHRLFLWNYEDGSEFHAYEEQDQIIISVALVKPRTDVLDSQINHLLVLATPLEAILLGVASRPSKKKAGGEVTFYSTQLNVPTDNVSMHHMVGSAAGRIFMAGSDSNLYEIVYAAEEGWFSRRCRKVNLTASIYSYLMPSFLTGSESDPVIHMVVDDSRQLLYTLSSQSHIEVYYLGPGGDEFHHVCRNDSICRSTLALCPSSAVIQRNNFVIVSLHVVPASESRRFHLVASTSTGCRLYFTTVARDQRFYDPSFDPSTLPPTCLDLLHVRLPPLNGPTAAQPPARPTARGSQVSTALLDVHCAFYSHEIYLGASGLGEDMDTLVTLAPDTGRVVQLIASQSSRVNLTEFTAAVAIEGKTWAVAECPQTSVLGSYLPQTENSLLTQALTPPRQFLVLTNSGINLLTHQRPVEFLYQLLAGANSADRHFTTFMAHYGPAQTCAMCLQILCSDRWSGDAATPGFSPYDRLPNPAVLSKARSIFFDLAGNTGLATQALGATHSALASSSSSTPFSYRYQGLVLYLSRLLSPLWYHPFLRVRSTPLDDTQFELVLPYSVLTAVQRQLSDLQAFVTRNPQFVPPNAQALSSFVNKFDTPASAGEAANWQSERRALYGLSLLLTYASEAIAFLQLLHEFKMTAVVQQIPAALQADLLKMQFKDLVSAAQSRDLCREIVIAMLHLHSTTNANTVVDLLRKRCGHFCNADDITLYKAMETLLRAKGTLAGPERQHLLSESLQLFERIAVHLSVLTLDDICETYKQYNFAQGAAQLALACAKAIDPLDQGLKFYLEGGAEGEGPNGAELYTHRKQCYERVFSVLAALEQPNARARSTPPDNNRKSAMQLIMATRDPLFFYCLYDWYLSRGDTHDVLEMDSPYLEAFLTKEPVDLVKCDLLWKYYARSNKFLEAAKVLSNLAESTQFPLDLPTRLEYLSLAVGNARSALNGSQRAPTGYSLLQDLEEKLEVAQIQLEIQRRLTTLDDPVPPQVRLRLNGALLTISDLYNDYAEPFSLYDMMLLIFKASNHHDPEYVESLWTIIFQDVQARVAARFGEATEVDGSDPAVARALLDAVSGQVRQLGQLLYPSDLAFPLKFLCPVLEGMALERAAVAPAGWCPQLLRAVGVPFGQAFEILHAMVEIRAGPWKTPAGLTFLVRDIVDLLSQWLDSLGQSRHPRRPTTGVEEPDTFPANLVDQALTQYIILLTAIDAPALLTEIQTAQRRIHQLF